MFLEVLKKEYKSALLSCITVPFTAQMLLLGLLAMPAHGVQKMYAHIDPESIIELTTLLQSTRNNTNIGQPRILEFQTNKYHPLQKTHLLAYPSKEHYHSLVWDSANNIGFKLQSLDEILADVRKSEQLKSFSYAAFAAGTLALAATQTPGLGFAMKGLLCAAGIGGFLLGAATFLKAEDPNPWCLLHTKGKGGVMLENNRDYHLLVAKKNITHYINGIRKQNPHLIKDFDEDERASFRNYHPLCNLVQGDYGYELEHISPE